MTQEDKQLLLRDICGRLPYGIYAKLPNHHLVSHKYYINECNVKAEWTTGILICAGRKECYSAEIEDVRPYLRSMSSMTTEEKNEYYQTFRTEPYGSGIGFIYVESAESFDWLNAHHFDYRGLIPNGLAISTEVFNPYKD